MRGQLERLWYGDSAGTALLLPLAWAYGAVSGLRRQAYRSGLLRARRLTRPVVVVGNLTVGGTGKTPLTIWLAQQLSAARLRVGIVSRGYGRQGAGVRSVQGDSDWRDVGDEPVILARRTGCPTMVGADRVAAARTLIARGAEVILADDGLQHLRLGRDCSIVVIDGSRGFGNGRLLPAGPLREPAAALRRADIVIVNGAPVHGSLGGGALAQGALSMQLVAQPAVRLDGRAGSAGLGAFRGRRVHAVAGIGNPQRFFSELRSQGIEVIAHPFPDHHPFTARELAFADELPVLMTEKDAVKCAPFANARLWYVPVSAAFSEPDARTLRTRVLEHV
ncbi:MAG TPA: tetraacyldisaccharide 4'-kinase, partial [Steroidobacteraceae bacterium]|nr:tetraacyldisaccharide 4'-kinase [Steroidobacteraceae bacterium]